MPDITMCKGDDCPKREDCYRFTARPNGAMQSWFVTPPYNHERGECDAYWPNRQAGVKVEDSP